MTELYDFGDWEAPRGGELFEAEVRAHLRLLRDSIRLSVASEGLRIITKVDGSDEGLLAVVTSLTDVVRETPDDFDDEYASSIVDELLTWLQKQKEELVAFKATLSDDVTCDELIDPDKSDRCGLRRNHDGPHQS